MSQPEGRVDFLKAPGRSSDKFQPEEMDPSLAEHQSHECLVLPESNQTSFLILEFMKVRTDRERETRCLTQWDSWTSSEGGEGARALGLIPSGCPGPHASGYRSQIGTTPQNQRLQSRPDPAA
ncbi:hypothetical protein KOW79_016210 [Hemibagrus wyckioides]|uniref:Uncharacterized protein n=1 Tax=Hemibagrus wyckioides TaxID=337641 RepID=A0A9D3NGF6_9TELE|nr:hypothetical protein KOW79_016210 [Hemibagrus wyckioides]